MKLAASIGVAVLLVNAGLCNEEREAPRAPAPATLVRPTSTESMATIELPVSSQRALGLETARVEVVSANERAQVAGEVMVPPGREIVLAAPTGGRVAAAGSALPRPGEQVRAKQRLMALIPMAAVDRNARASAERDLEAARANQALAEARLERALAMTRNGSGSQRSVEDARAQSQVAQAEVTAAESRLRTLSGGALDTDVALSIESPVDGVIRAVRVAAGQSVPAGTALIDVAGTGRWVRASLTPADAHGAGERPLATARRIGVDEELPLAPVLAPPSADPLRGSIDRFFMLPGDAEWTPGERVTVELGIGRATRALAVPASALVRDAEGGAWVYEQTAPETFRRRRVEPLWRESGRFLLARGLAEEARVVSAGAVELWGFELGADR